MGAILVDGMLVTGVKTIQNRLKEIINDDDNNVIHEQDFYTGHFGATIDITKSSKTYKGKTKDKIEGNMAKFLEEENFEKYIIKYAIIGQLGYIAYKLKVKTHHITRGKVYLWVLRENRINGCDIHEFNNITELKKFIRDIPDPYKYINSDIKDDKYNTIGYIGSEKRKYKTKPRTLPKKYDYIDELVAIGYAAFNPY